MHKVLNFVLHAAVKRAATEGNLQQTMAHARIETETALIVCIDKVLKRTGLKPSQVQDWATQMITNLFDSMHTSQAQTFA